MHVRVCVSLTMHTTASPSCSLHAIYTLIHTIAAVIAIIAPLINIPDAYEYTLR
jgi:hypothetical protein